VVDAGANIDIITGQLAAKVGSEGQVHAFEPLPRNIAKLERLREENGLSQVTVHPFALGAENGTAELRLPGVGGGAYASFTASWIDEGRLEVEVRTVDGVLDGAAPSLMKIDVEGFEHQVLQGASKTLAEHRPLLFLEINHVILEDSGSSGAEFLQLIDEEFDYIVSPEHRHLVAGAHTGLATLMMQHRER
jgi:FkbM family methyltransferase